METPAAALDLAESDREGSAGKKASLALQRALNGTGAWMFASVRDQRKCDHALLPAEMPASIRAKVARILQNRGGKEKVSNEVADPKAPWHQQLELHVARLMQQMRSQPQQFRQLLLMAASEPCADNAVNSSSVRTFVDAHRAYRRIRRAAVALGEEIFYMVRGFVRRSEAHGVLPQDAQVIRLASLYKLELRRHVTISAVMECIRQADSGIVVLSSTVHGTTKPGFCVINKTSHKHPPLRRQIKSAGVTTSGSGGHDSALSPRAASAPADATGRTGQSQLNLSDPGSLSDKIKSVHAFKLQALERLLASSWQGSRSVSTRSLHAVPTSPTKLSDETLIQIQERVTAFLYHRSRENYPLWDEPPLSREETARYLRMFVATLLTTPLLQSLTIDQLLEVARAAKWQILAPGDTLCFRNTDMDALVVVLDGSLVASTAPASPSHPVSLVSGPSATITAPACLGELAMVRNTERWPRTLLAQSTGGAKVLTLPKMTFEALLHRFFNGGKAVPPATISFLQPRRPSSSPAVIAARRLITSFRNSQSARRLSTATPSTAMKTNIARWHQVRDEKLRDYRAGLEAEQRSAALEALQSAMAELSSTSVGEEDVDCVQHSVSRLSPRKESWSWQEYLACNPTSSEVDNPEHYLSNEQPQSSSIEISEEAVPSTSATEFADQLREFYRALNARRSVMKARLASSAPSDQMVQLSPERKTSNAGAQAAVVSTTTTATTWWIEKEEAENWTNITSQDELRESIDDVVGSVSGGSPLFRGRLRSASFSSQVSHRSATSSPSKKSLSPLKSPIKSENPQQESSTGGTSSKGSDAIWLSNKTDDVAPETNEYDGATSSDAVSKNQMEDERAAGAATLTRARKSALNLLLTRQSTVTMTRQSKLLDKKTAQQILIQKHFADTSTLIGTGNRPQSRRPASSQHAQSTKPEVHQSHSHAPLPLRADLQHRMDAVLSDLQLPPQTKLDMVLKYTHSDHYDQFPMAVQLWERVQQGITWRERVLKSLWDFELLASDPRRHFRSLSTHRLREEKERDAWFDQLNQASNACLEAMDELWRCCGDTVSLGDRSYRDKMKKDYTELLYDVEQERLRVIYNGVRPCVAPAIEEKDDDDTRDEKLFGYSSAGRTLIDVLVPSALTIPRGLAPRRPLNKKDGGSPGVSVTTHKEYAPISSVHDNQEHEPEDTRVQSPTFTVNGANTNPTSARFSLTTPRESIFVPLSSLGAQQESSTKQHIKKPSRVTVQVQQQRQTEFSALSKQLEQRQKDLTPSEALRSPEKTFVAPAKAAKKAASRLKQQEERTSLREMFQHFMTRSNKVE